MRTFLISLVIWGAGHTYAWALNYQEIKDAYYQSYHYERIQDYTKSVQAIKKVFKTYPKSYTINLRLGWLYYLKKNYANAIYHYEKAIQLAPGAVEPKLGYMLPLLAQEKYEKVETLAHKVLAIDPLNYYGNLRLSIALRHQKKFDLDEKEIRKMLLLYPTNVAFLTEMALIKSAQGKKKSALNIFGDIIILDPDNASAKLHLGIK
ncbi:tetratricopeptide repeat protein [bacterium]|nr:tetratricopeptide repeat protein [bacterium]